MERLIIDEQKLYLACARHGCGIIGALRGAHVAVATITRIRKGLTIRPTTLHKLAKYFGVDVVDLLKDA